MDGTPLGMMPTLAGGLTATAPTVVSVSDLRPAGLLGPLLAASIMIASRHAGDCEEPLFLRLEVPRLTEDLGRPGSPFPLPLVIKVASCGSPLRNNSW